MIAFKQIGEYVMNVAADYPVLTGVIPSFLSVGVSFVDGLEIGLRLGTLVLGCIAAGLTVIARIRKNKRESKDDRTTGNN